MAAVFDRPKVFFLGGGGGGGGGEVGAGHSFS